MRAGVTLNARQLASFRDDGFVHLRRFLDPAEVQAMRAASEAHFAAGAGRRVGGGLVEQDLHRRLPAVGQLLADPRALAIARQLVGPTVLHPRQDALHQGPVNRGWHKDALDYLSPSPRGAVEDWGDDYRLVHFAYYLQDHRAHGGATSFRRGSHRVRNHDDGPVVTLDIDAGDLVVFDLRTTHYGNTRTLRAPFDRVRNAVFLPPIERDAPLAVRLAGWLANKARFVFLPDHEDRRLVIFFVYGADDEHTRRFFRWLRSEPDCPHLAVYDEPLRLPDGEAPSNRLA